MRPTLLTFLFVGALYMLSGIWIQVRYWETITRSIPLAFIFFGGGILTAVNSWWLFADLDVRLLGLSIPEIALYVAAGFLLGGLVSAIVAVRIHVGLQDRILELEKGSGT